MHGKRPFQCGQCSGSFAYERDLKKHAKAGCHVIIECKDCGKRYASLESLAVHRGRKHGLFSAGKGGASAERDGQDSSEDEASRAIGDADDNHPRPCSRNELPALATSADSSLPSSVSRQSSNVAIATSRNSLLPKPCAASSPIYILPIMTVVVNNNNARDSHCQPLVGATSSQAHIAIATPLPHVGADGLRRAMMEALQPRQRTTIAVQASSCSRPSVATQTAAAVAAAATKAPALHVQTYNGGNGNLRVFNGMKPKLSSSTQTVARKRNAAHTQTTVLSGEPLAAGKDSYQQASAYLPDVVRQSSVAVMSPRNSSGRTYSKRKGPALSKDTQTSSTVRVRIPRERCVTNTLTLPVGPIVEREQQLVLALPPPPRLCASEQRLPATDNSQLPLPHASASCDSLLSGMSANGLLFAADYELALAESAATQTCDFGSLYATRVASREGSYGAAYHRQQQGAFAVGLPDAAAADGNNSIVSTDHAAESNLFSAVPGGGPHAVIDIETQTGRADFDFADDDDFLSPDVQRLFADAAAYMNMETQTSMDDILDQLLSDMQTQTTDTNTSTTCCSVGTDIDLQFDGLLSSPYAVGCASSNSASNLQGLPPSTVGIHAASQLEFADIHTQTNLLARYDLPPDVVECDTQTNLDDWIMYS